METSYRMSRPPVVHNQVQDVRKGEHNRYLDGKQRTDDYLCCMDGAGGEL